jgi:Hpt domain
MTDARAQNTAMEAQFVARIDGIRARFALRFADHLQQTDAALRHMTGNGPDAVGAVATAYRWFHDAIGICATIGFDATGRLARSCEAILAEPFRAQRGLSPDELALLTQSLESLRITALAETASTKSTQGSAP